MNQTKPLIELDTTDIKGVTFDMDGVTIEAGTELRGSKDGTELYMKSKSLSSQFIDDINVLKKKVHVNFSSGRNLLYLQEVLAPVADKNVSLQGENGNLMLLHGRLYAEEYEFPYFNKLAAIKREVLNENIRGFEPKHLILTIHCDESDRILDIVKRNDPEGELYCLATDEGYDIGHNRWNKGRGVEKLCDHLNITPRQMVTTGNNYNDAEMLLCGTGVTVNPDRVWGQYKTSGKGLGGEEVARYLVENL